MPRVWPTALREDLGMQLHGEKVLLLGAGGAGRTAALKLASENVSELFLVNRHSKQGRGSGGGNKKTISVSACRQWVIPKPQLIWCMNATSLGLKPGDPSPLDEKQFSLRQARAVYDMI